jgi:hypothetical protein
MPFDVPVSAARRRLLLSVEPRILNDTLERLIAAAGADEVVAVVPGTAVEGTFDTAIVEAGHATIDATVVLELEDGDAGGRVTVHEDGTAMVIDLRNVADIIDLLDEHGDGDHRRRDSLRRRGL